MHQDTICKAFEMSFKKNPGWFELHKWIITFCSALKTGGNGFLEIDNDSTGEKIDFAAGEFLLKPKVLKENGLYPLRRNGHPDCRFYVAGFEFIPNDECWALQLANAAGVSGIVLYVTQSTTGLRVRLKTHVCIRLRLILRSFHQCFAPKPPLAALGFHIVRVRPSPSCLLLARSRATADGSVRILQRLVVCFCSFDVAAFHVTQC